MTTIKHARMRTSTDPLVNGRQLRAARVMAGYSQEELGAAAGYSGRAVRAWEANECGPLPCVSSARERLRRALSARGVEVFRDPTPGVRLLA